MPQIVEKKRAAELLRVGDKVVFRKREHTVESLRNAVKYTTMTFMELTEEYRIEKYAQMTVLVEEPTPQENYERVLKSAARTLRDKLISNEPNFRKAKADYVATINHPTYLLDGFATDKFYAAQVSYEWYKKVENRIRRADGEDIRSGRELKPLSETLERIEDAELLEIFDTALRRSEDERLGFRVGNLRLDINSVIKVIEQESLREIAERLNYAIEMYRHAKKIMEGA